MVCLEDVRIGLRLPGFALIQQKLENTKVITGRFVNKYISTWRFQSFFTHKGDVRFTIKREQEDD